MFDPFLFVTALVIVLLIVVLVGAHELGHYLFARLYGMGVEEFAIGFGHKPLWTWMRRRYKVDPRKETRLEGSDDVAVTGAQPEYETTDFTIRPWPLGGFVRIKGMVPQEDGSEVNVPGGFYSKAPWQRWVVLCMGPVFSIIAGLALVVPVLLQVGEKPTGRAVIGFVKKDSPAEKAGLKAGDKILAIGGEPVSNWYGLVSKVRGHGPTPLRFEVQRNGRTIPLSIEPTLAPDKTPVLDEKLEPTRELKRQWIIGAGGESRKLAFGEALSLGAMLPIKMVAGLAGIVAQPSQFKDQMGGPVAIAQAADSAAREGLLSIVHVAGLLSMSLGILNLLPIPPFDGGQMMVAIVEMLRRGRRLSFRVQNWVYSVGFVMIFMLIIGVFAADISRLIEKPEKPSAVKGKQP